jgi:LacI family transcriptional regulator
LQSPSRKQVVLLVETSNSYGRSVLSGIVRYMRMHDEWSVYLEQRDLTAKPPAWLMDWKGDGIISRVTTPELLDATRTTGVPVVDVTDRKRNSGFVSIRTDDERVGELGAEHLMERGFQRFGFCGYTNEAWSERRLRGFRRKLDSRGFSCTLYSSGWLDFSSSSWEEEQEQLTLWLRSQKRPIGIMACNDIRGHNLITACAREGFAVPEEVAILGVDNDELLCRVCDPALSSVVVKCRRSWISRRRNTRSTHARKKTLGA